jgi:glycosyltransferase involved in cell wall biosynthesis
MAIAWIEEWMSWRAYNVLPILAKKFDIIYIACGKEIPSADFKDVYLFPKRKYMNAGGIELSKCANKLYRERKIDFAYTYSNIGFLLRKVPYINLSGLCFFECIKIFYSISPWYKRPKFLTGFIHYALPEYIACKRAAKLIANSNSLKVELIKHYKRKDEDVYLAYNGIGDEYLEKFNYKFNHKMISELKIVYIGRLHIQKGIFRLIVEFAKRKKLPMQFIVIGDGPDYQKIKMIAEKDNRILMTGHIKRADLLKHLDHTNIFVWPTLCEGFGNGLAEGMASGHACLAYDIPVNREMLGDAGILCKFNNPKDMIDRLEWLVSSNEIAKYAFKAHEKIKKFSWGECAKKIEEVFNNMYLELGKTHGSRE